MVGSGFIARGLAHVLQSHPEYSLRHVLTRRDVRRCSEFPRPDLLTNSLEQVIDHSDLIVECSGDVVHATRVVDAALQAGLPVVTMDAEFHVTTGSYFVGKGLLTEAEGDQPGSLAAMAEEARDMGFRILVYGNRKGYYHPDPPRDQMEFWAKKQGLSIDQVTGFTDGTKVQIEQALVANGLGATIVQDGMLGLDAEDLTSGGLALVAHAVKLNQPISDYVVAPKAPAGIFLVTEQDPRQQPYLDYLKLGPGPYYVLIHNYHLCHLEIPKTIKRVLRGDGALLDNSTSPTVSIAAIAKRELTPGQRIRRGIGSFELRGEAVRIADHPNHLPIGLVSDAVMARRVAPGQRLSMDDAELPDSLAVRAWAQIRERAVAQPGAKAAVVALEGGRSPTWCSA
jgi:predicted homoserine dehydrogenase-like protein